MDVRSGTVQYTGKLTDGENTYTSVEDIASRLKNWCLVEINDEVYSAGIILFASHGLFIDGDTFLGMGITELSHKNTTVKGFQIDIPRNAEYITVTWN